MRLNSLNSLLLRLKNNRWTAPAGSGVGELPPVAPTRNGGRTRMEAWHQIGIMGATVILIVGMVALIRSLMPPRWASPDEHCLIGADLAHQGRTEEAIVEFEAALAFWPGMDSTEGTVAHLNLGTMAMRQKRYDDAVEHYARALDGAPGNPAMSDEITGEVLLNLSAALELQANSNKAPELNPTPNPLEHNQAATQPFPQNYEDKTK